MSNTPFDWNREPEEIYDALMAQVDPGMHHDRELTEFYDRIAPHGLPT